VNDSVNDSRSGSVNGSLPSRAPADQGKERIREQGSGNARARLSPDWTPNRSSTTDQRVAAGLDLAKRLERKAIQ
jgi:hypothetical protein